MTKSRNIIQRRRVWSDYEISIIRAQYPHQKTADIAALLGLELALVYRRAALLGLHKSEAFAASDKSGRLFKGGTQGQKTQFCRGQVPWNKGTHFTAGGRSAETRFKKGAMQGAAQHNYVPIGSLRVSKDGYLERKMNDDPNVYPARRWIAVHRLVWVATHGPIPTGHIVVYKPGQKTSVESEITTSRLECISRAEHARRNHPRSHSPELTKLVQLKGAITRQVNRIQKESLAS